MKGTEEEVEMGTKDSNGVQINQWCRSPDQANSVQAPAQRDWMHLTESCSQSWTWVIFRINGESAGRVLGAVHIDVETDSTAAIGMDSRTSVE